MHEKEKKRMQALDCNLCAFLVSLPLQKKRAYKKKDPSREGGKSYPVRLFPHGSLKKTLKRKGKHTSLIPSNPSFKIKDKGHYKQIFLVLLRDTKREA